MSQQSNDIAEKSNRGRDQDQLEPEDSAQDNLNNSVYTAGGRVETNGRVGMESAPTDWKIQGAVQTDNKVISGNIFPNLLNTQVGKYEEFMGDADVLVPETIMERPRRRLKAIEALREELMAETDGVHTRILHIYNRLQENVFNDKSDEGFLEIAVENYQRCFDVQVSRMQSMLDSEVERLRNEYMQAKEESRRLIEQMEHFLKQNHVIVQDFLQSTHKAIVSLAKPQPATQSHFNKSESMHRRMGSEAKIRPDHMRFQNHGTSIMRASLSANTAAMVEPMPAQLWMPDLVKTVAFGVTCENRFEWPTLHMLKSFDLRKRMKLSAIEIGASELVSAHLYGIRLHFTGRVSSPYIRATRTSHKSYRRMELDSQKTIQDVYIYQDEKTGNISGIRMLDQAGQFLIDQLWNRVAEHDRSSPSTWRHFRIPNGYQLIGVHGSDDGTYLKSFGLIIWAPNPEAQQIY